MKTDVKKAFDGDIAEICNLMKITGYGAGFLEMIPKDLLDHAIDISIPTPPIAQSLLRPSLGRGCTTPYIWDAELGVISGGKLCGSNKLN